jgi:zinc and cadmium transporter
MENSVIVLLALAILGSVAGLIGGVIFLIKREWAKVLSIYAVPFAAGVLLSVSVLHLIPEVSDEIGHIGFLYVLMAFLASFVFEKYFASLHHHENHAGTLQKATITLILLGDTIHNFIDGVAIAAAYITNPVFGCIVALSTFLHETPHEIGDFGVLISRGWSGKKTFMANLFSSMATIPGALMVYYFFPEGAADKIAVLLAISAGVFLYLGASDFLPEIGENDSRKRTFIKVALVIIGVIIMYSLSFIVPAI